MSEHNTAVAMQPLADIAHEVEKHANASDEHVIKAAMLVREARSRIEAGEFGDIKWFDWGRNNIKLSPSRLRELQRIAKADNPKAELERLRGLAAERAKMHRAKKAAEKGEMEEERRELIAWAKDASIKEVRQVLDQIAGRTGGAVETSIRRSLPPETLQAA